MKRPERVRRCQLLLCLMLAGCEGSELLLGTGHDIRVARDAGSPDAGHAPSNLDAGHALSADAGTLELPHYREPQLIEGLATTSESKDDDPSLSADRLLLCFNSKRDGGSGKEDIWCSERASFAEHWSKPTPVSALNTEARETGIALALDGLTLWFSSDRDDKSNLDVYVSRRDSRAAQWSTPERVAELCSSDDDLVSSVDVDARNLYLARRGSGNYDLYLATRVDASSSWRAPTPIEELNTDANESDAYPVLEGRGLLFTRSKELMLARRKSAGDRFEAPQLMAALNSSRDDRDAWSEPDLSYVVFSSDRSGEYRLYEAEAAPGEP